VAYLLHIEAAKQVGDKSGMENPDGYCKGDVHDKNIGGFGVQQL
jgi:hypothetical protein